MWAQEEPQNMGAFRAIRHRLEEAAGGLPLRYVGRPWRASPSEGYPTAHLRAQDRIARALFLSGPLAAAAAAAAIAILGPCFRAREMRMPALRGGSRARCRKR